MVFWHVGSPNLGWGTPIRLKSFWLKFISGDFLCFCLFLNFDFLLAGLQFLGGVVDSGGGGGGSLLLRGGGLG